MRKTTVLSTIILILSLHFLASTSLRASHYSAGEIFYEWIGDEPGKSKNTYRIYATIYRNLAGVSPGTLNLDGCVYRKSNNQQISASLNYQSPSQPLDSNYTIKPGDPYGWIDNGVHPNDPDGWALSQKNACDTSGKDFSEYRYVSEVTLPGAYRDWRIAIHPPCCRDANDNLSSSGELYMEVRLDNSMGRNSSPRFLGSALNNFCVKDSTQRNKPFTIDMSTGEEDGDSIHYSFHPKGSQEGGSCNSASPLPYVTGLSANYPIWSSPAPVFDQNNAALYLQPTRAGNYVVKLKATEYRYDTTGNLWRPIGYTTREIQVSVASSCHPNNWSWSFTQNGVKDTLSASCGDSVLKFRAPVQIQKSSVAADASDFSLTNSQGNLVPLQNARYSAASSEIILTLTDTVDFNDTLDLTVRTGSDTNSLISTCSYELQSVDTLIVITSGCKPDTGSGMNLAEQRNNDFKLYPNPVKGTLFLKGRKIIPSQTLLEIFTVQGHLLRKMIIRGKAGEIDVSSLPEGVYLLRIKTGESYQTRRFVKS